ncbi:uncharacterized protein LOC107995350 isoform X1 [Apis cerana]|uniref:Translation initiation factor IF-3, chloroplastic n=1 Tax=Apis cerana cerana TaxID=94128 RepID=A0A2A3EU06_APICC|nr:uncharacterized protein LOC107995350 isoform X1 [Apis cerana]PBC34752.1 Translation initiation factor IF-3, chloroplastic [Apis cerana cerana]
MLRLLRTRLFRINKSFLIKNENKEIQYVQNNCLWHQNINFDLNNVNNLEEKTDKKKKIPKIPKITLIHPNNSITVTVLEDAEKLADRRNLQLVHVSDQCKNNRQIYKLVEYSKIKEKEENEEEEEKEKEKKYDKKKIKSTKLFTIKSDIMDYDLNIKINNINKVLKKNHKVKIFFIHRDGIRDGIIESVKSKVQGIFSEQKIKKGNTIFLYSPLEDENNSSKNNTV